MKEKIKILEVIKCLDIGGIGGGAERFGADLAIALSQRKMDVNICVFYKTFSKTEKNWITKLNNSGIGVFFLADWKGSHELPEFFRGVNRFQALKLNLCPDIVHSHTQFGTIASIFSSIFQRDIKIVRTAHVTQEWGSSFYSKLQKLIWGELIFPLFVDAQVAVSKAVQESVKKYIGYKLTRKKIHLIYNSIPFPRREENIRKFNNFRKDSDFIVGTAARLTEQKGIIYLIKAAEIVSHQNPNVKFLIAGEGELKDELMKKISQAGLYNQVFLIGKHPNIYEFLSQIDLFVLPSLWEGLPTVVLEAMWAGVPVVATNIPGTDELIKDGINGWLVQPKNSMELASKIINAVNSPVLLKQFVKVATDIINQFSMDKITDQYLDLFNKLLMKTN